MAFPRFATDVETTGIWIRATNRVSGVAWRGSDVVSTVPVVCRGEAAAEGLVAELFMKAGSDQVECRKGARRFR